ncbi:MauE/DoxX family redox-associated membrane protein [Pedobacter sp. MC2016-24]|uniref:MauE/DoxX family redox-associated membrane protein n=1 Tax=Pedobacter sp. MC2016-24 TaxID=2780090 RepID=UPI0018809165|nr:MauE/DoxX family redox-associated membrane protein [Pedobacter sp. MC2016-24]MBE9599837.1 hypothetical protein [Pedobacter sp. MC2016-24]
MKTKGRLNEFITFIPAVLLLMLWGYAAVSKIAEYNKFVLQMQLAPVPLMKLAGPVLGWLVPAVELLLVLLLLKDKFRIVGLWSSFFLLLVFEIYITVMLSSGLHLPCTCGGLISKLQWKEHLIFNAIFMLVALFPMAYTWINHKFFSSRYSPRSIYK